MYEANKADYSGHFKSFERIACNSNGNQSTGTPNESNGAQASSPTDNLKTTSDLKNTSVTKEIISQYLHIKDALANDNGSDATTSENAIMEATAKVEVTSLSADQKKIWVDISADA